MGMIRMTRATLRQIRTHGEQAYPHESCGVLLGRSDHEGWDVRTAVPTENASRGSTRNRYEIAPLQLFRIEQEAGDLGMEIAGFYHSHPDHPAQWSTTDLAQAHWLGSCYMITEVVQGKSAVTNSFLLSGETEEGKRFERQVILVDERASGETHRA